MKRFISIVIIMSVVLTSCGHDRRGLGMCGGVRNGERCADRGNNGNEAAKERREGFNRLGLYAACSVLLVSVVGGGYWLLVKRRKVSDVKPPVPGESLSVRIEDPTVSGGSSLIDSLTKLVQELSRESERVCEMISVNEQAKMFLNEIIGSEEVVLRVMDRIDLTYGLLSLKKNEKLPQDENYLGLLPLLLEIVMREGEPYVNANLVMEIIKNLESSSDNELQKRYMHRHIRSLLNRVQKMVPGRFSFDLLLKLLRNGRYIIRLSAKISGDMSLVPDVLKGMLDFNLLLEDNFKDDRDTLEAFVFRFLKIQDVNKLRRILKKKLLVKFIMQNTLILPADNVLEGLLTLEKNILERLIGLDKMKVSALFSNFLAMPKLNIIEEYLEANSL